MARVWGRKTPPIKHHQPWPELQHKTSLTVPGWPSLGPIKYWLGVRSQRHTARYPGIYKHVASTGWGLELRGKDGFKLTHTSQHREGQYSGACYTNLALTHHGERVSHTMCTSICQQGLFKEYMYLLKPANQILEVFSHQKQGYRSMVSFLEFCFYTMTKWRSTLSECFRI